MKRNKTLTLITIILLVFAISSPSFAQVISIVATHEGVNYEYNLEELEYSFLNFQVDEDSSSAALYRHYMSKDSIAFFDDVRGYIDLEDVEYAYLLAQLQGSAFDLDNYTENDAEKVDEDSVSNLKIVKVNEAGEVVVEPKDPIIELVVESISAINATTISVTFEGMDPVNITLVEALVHGQTEVSFVYKDVEYTATLDEAFVDPDVVAAEALAAATNAVVAAEASEEQADVDAALELVNALPAGDAKDDLIARLEAVQDAIDEAAAAEEAAEKLAATTNAVVAAEASEEQEDVNAAMLLVNALPEGEAKELLLARLQTVQDAIDAAQTAADKLEAAIEAAELAIAALPSVEEVAIADKADVAAAKALVETVKALDPTAEVEGEELIALLEDKIAELEGEAADQAKAAAIADAIDKINALGNPNDVTLADEDDVVAARVAVELALELGATESDIVNLDVLLAAEDKIADVIADLNEEELRQRALQEAIKAANIAITRVPLKANITLANRELVSNARGLVEAAKLLGAEDEDFVNLWKLTEAEGKIVTLENDLTDAISKAEVAIENLPALEDSRIPDKQAVLDAISLLDEVKALDPTAEVEGEVLLAELLEKIVYLEQELANPYFFATINMPNPEPRNTLTVSEVLFEGTVTGIKYLEKILVSGEEAEYTEENGVYTFTKTLTLSDGNQEVSVEAISQSGHNSDWLRRFYIDTTAPELTVTPVGVNENNEIAADSVELTINVKDNFAGIVLYEYYDSWYEKFGNDGSHDTYILPVNETFTYDLDLDMGENKITFRLKDAAGLWSENAEVIITRVPNVAETAVIDAEDAIADLPTEISLSNNEADIVAARALVVAALELNPTAKVKGIDKLQLAEETIVVIKAVNASANQISLAQALDNEFFTGLRAELIVEYRKVLGVPNPKDTIIEIQAAIDGVNKIADDNSAALEDAQKVINLKNAANQFVLLQLLEEYEINNVRVHLVEEYETEINNADVLTLINVQEAIDRINLAEDLAAAKEAAEAAIEKLPVQVTLDNRDEVEAARNLVTFAEELDENVEISNINKLVEAEGEIARLDKEVDDKAAAKSVEDKIALLPENITLDHKAEVEAVRTAFNNLTEAQIAFVPNEDVLKAAETRILVLEQEKADDEAVANVKALIAALPNAIDVRLSHTEQISEAKVAYEKLDEELVERLTFGEVNKYNAVVDALKTLAEGKLNGLVAAISAAPNADAAQALIEEAKEAVEALIALEVDYVDTLIATQQLVVNGMFDAEAVAAAKASLTFVSQAGKTINKPADNNGVSFTLAVSNLNNNNKTGLGGTNGNAVIENENINITRRQNGVLGSGSETFTFDMTVTIKRGAATDTKVFVVTVPKTGDITFTVK